MLELNFTNTVGIIFLCIGAALFASLLVAWLLGRRKRKQPARYNLVWSVDNLFVKQADGAMLEYRVDVVGSPSKPKPAPYAPIAGTGSRPEAPWASKEDVNKLADSCVDGLNSLSGVINQHRDKWVEHLGAIYEALVKLGDEEAKEQLRQYDPARLARLARLEAGGEGDGWGVFRYGERWSRVFADGLRVWVHPLGAVAIQVDNVEVAYRQEHMKCWSEHPPMVAPHWTDADYRRWNWTEIPPTDPRYAEVVESWRNREGA